MVTRSIKFAALALTLLLLSACNFSRTLVWEKPTEGQNLTALVAMARHKAATEKRPVFMDFTAAWCTACKEIEKKTFPDDRVQQAAGRFISIKMDMTDSSDPAVESAFDDYEIRGLPTLVLFDSSGKEAVRFNGNFVSAERLAAAMNTVQ